MTKTPIASLIACLAMAVLLPACKPAAAPAVTQAPAQDAVLPATTDTPAAPVPQAAPPEPQAAPSAEIGAEYPQARDACVAAVAKKTGVAAEKLVVTEVLWAQAGVGVTVQVPEAQAPWSCLADEKGNVQGAAYTGSEGKL